MRACVRTQCVLFTLLLMRAVLLRKWQKEGEQGAKDVTTAKARAGRRRVGKVGRQDVIRGGNFARVRGSYIPHFRPRRAAGREDTKDTSQQQKRRAASIAPFVMRA